MLTICYSLLGTNSVIRENKGSYLNIFYAKTDYCRHGMWNLVGVGKDRNYGIADSTACSHGQVYENAFTRTSGSCAYWSLNGTK